MSALVVAEWDVFAVKIDPDNERLFTKMDDGELDLLAASIREVGIIQPITIRADGRIIAGEQRFRAALLARLTTVPVIVREDISEGEVEKIRIHENLMRRGLKPSEQARGIQRLYELHGIEHGNNQHGGQEGARRTLRSVAEQIGWTANKAKVYHTLANLIEPLAERWDKGKLTRDVAYQIAQLPPLHQQAIVLLFQEAEQVPDLTKEVAEYKRQVARIVESEVLPPSEREKELDEALVKLRLAHQREVDALSDELETTRRKKATAERQLSGAQRWADADAVHRTLGRMGTLTGLDPVTYVERLDGFDAIAILLRADLEIAEGVQEWLRRYAHSLRQRLEVPQKRLMEVQRVSDTEVGTHR